MVNLNFRQHIFVILILALSLSGLLNPAYAYKSDSRVLNGLILEHIADLKQSDLPKVKPLRMTVDDFLANPGFYDARVWRGLLTVFDREGRELKANGRIWLGSVGIKPSKYYLLMLEEHPMLKHLRADFQQWPLDFFYLGKKPSEFTYSLMTAGEVGAKRTWGEPLQGVEDLSDFVRMQKDKTLETAYLSQLNDLLMNGHFFNSNDKSYLLLEDIYKNPYENLVESDSRVHQGAAANTGLFLFVNQEGKRIYGDALHYFLIKNVAENIDRSVSFNEYKASSSLWPASFLALNLESNFNKVFPNGGIYRVSTERGTRLNGLESDTQVRSILRLNRIKLGER